MARRRHRHDGIPPQSLDFDYQIAAAFGGITAGSWVDHDALDFTGPISGATTGTVLDGNATANRTAKSSTITVTVPPGSYAALRWEDLDSPSSDHGLAVDDLSITATVGSEAAPAVSSTAPTNGATGVAIGSNLTVNFSEPVSVIGDWFTINCASSGMHTGTSSGGPTSFTINPDGDFAQSEQCDVTIVAGSVSDIDSDDPPDGMDDNHAWSFTTASPPVPIHTIQGAAHLSPLSGQSVSSVPGIVTARRLNGFWIQDPNPDADPATSEAIFVFTNSAPTVAVGDSLLVSGNVTEFRPGGDPNNLTITEITSPTVSVLSAGNPLPAATVIGSGGSVPPSEVIEDDASNVETTGAFDPASDGIDFYESLEGMLVQVDDPVVVGPTNDFEEIWVVGDGGTNASVRTTRGGVVIRSSDFNPERIQLDDTLFTDPMPVANVGDALSTVVGVVNYEFGNFEVLPTSAPTRTDNLLTREVAQAAGPGELSIASFNVENLDANDGAAKFGQLAGLIVTNLRSPDILAVEEIQDNNGATNDGTVDATVTFNTLIAAIQAAGGPTYEFRQINPVNGADGGEPGGNIRVGFLFRPDRGVTFVDRPGGTATSATAVVSGADGPELSFSPGRIDPTNPAFNSSRKPLAGEFVFNGQRFFLIANHFNSKGGDQPLFGPTQPPILSSEVQRNQQATIVKDFVGSILAADANAQVVVLGDLNDFEFSSPLTILENAGLNALIETLPPAERYGYVFDGNSQALDHLLVSNALGSLLLGYDVVHVNSEFAEQASDHDPPVAIFSVSVPNTAPVATNDSYTTNEDTTVTVSAPGVLGNDSDVDANPLTASLVSGPAHGTLTFNTNGSFTYTPAADYNGPDSFTYRASDGTTDSNVATATLAVQPVNDAPVATNDSYTTNEDTTVTVSAPGVLGNDSDVDANPLTASLVSGPAHGTLTFNTNGSFIYTPRLSRTDNGPNSFTYRASDGTVESNVAAVTLTVQPVNDAPVATNDSYTTNEDTTLTVLAPGVLGNDSDVDGNPLTASLVSGPAHGTLTFNANGSFTYTPAADYNGPDSFTYRANDGTAESNVATATLTVQPVNDAPVATPDSYTTNEDTTLTVPAPGVLGNDSDVDGNPLTASLVSGPAHGTLTFNTDGSFTYTPAADYNGPDSFTYRANDGTAESNVATVTLSVGNVNDPPTLAVVGGQCLSDNLALGQLSLSLSDVDTTATALTLQATSSNTGLLPNSGLTLAGSGATRTLRIEATDKRSGTAIVTLELSDGTTTTTLLVTVQVGSGKSETLNGGNGTDVMFGLSGRNTLNGGDGNDLLCGGNSDDTVNGGSGNDVLGGGRGADTLNGDAGNDTMTGGQGGDRFDGGANTDVVTDFTAGQGDTQVNVP